MRALQLFATASFLAAGCAIPAQTAIPAGLSSPYEGYASRLYDDPSMWVCRPDLPEDACDGDLTATEIRRDGTLSIVPHVPAEAPEVDCFYVYPTVDLGLIEGNHEDLADTSRMAQATLAQAARFTEACAVYAPLYRQVTIGTYLVGEERREARLAVAFSDVADAFLHYMGRYNRGRKVVLIGHSQGAEMVVRLLRRYFDHDPVMRERLLLAMPVGGDVDTKEGSATGGTFDTLPLCTRGDETGCVVAYRSHGGGYRGAPRRAASRPLRAQACVSPAAAADDGYAWFSRAYLRATPRMASRLPLGHEVKTPFVLLRDFYSGQCAEGERGYRYLAVWALPAPRDERVSPLDLDGLWFQTGMGLHVLDLQLAQGDLIDRVARAAASVSAKTP